METIRDAFAFNLKLLKGDRTQAEMAEFLGLPLRSYQKIEAGRIPQKATMKQITSKLGVTEVQLVQLPSKTPENTSLIVASDLDLLRDILKHLPSLDEDGLEAVLRVADRFAAAGNANQKVTSKIDKK